MLIPLATLADWFNTQFTDASTVIKNAVLLIIVAFAAYRAAKSGFGLAAIAIVALAAAFLYWLVIGGGIADIGGMINSQADQANTP